MRTRLTLKAGQPGTRKLLAEFGERLLYVRYRYDEERRLRVKTAEIIIETRTWTPTEPASDPDALEYVHIRFDARDKKTKTAVKRLGGYWDPDTATWRITRAAAILLDLTSRIYLPPAPILSTNG
jgi:hypothetical protein